MENNKPSIVFDNARLEDVPRIRLTNLIKRQIYSGVDCILCPAVAWNRTFEFFGIPTERIFYGLNVVDNSFWANTPDGHSRLIPGRYFLCIGRQILKKNFLFLLKAYNLYSKSTKEKPVHLVLIGNGPRRKVLETYIHENKLENVHFLEFSDQPTLRRYYKDALCFILPSRYGETWGLVVNEAMASGLPVLVSEQVGCSSTLVKEGFNGFLFGPEKVDKLARLMETMSAMDESEMHRMGKNSLAIVNNWGLSKFCSGVYDAIEYFDTRKKREVSLLNRVFIKLWKGRYKPA